MLLTIDTNGEINKRAKNIAQTFSRIQSIKTIRRQKCLIGSSKLKSEKGPFLKIICIGRMN